MVGVETVVPSRSPWVLECSSRSVVRFSRLRPRCTSSHYRALNLKRAQLISSAQQSSGCAPPDLMNPAERVTFKDAKGDILVGTLTLPDAKDVVVMCHGYCSHKNGFHLPALAQRLEAYSVASLRFDFSGNGESSGEFKFANYSQEVDQIEVAMEYLQSRGKHVVGLLGHSKGGTEVILYAARHDGDATRIVNVCGRCHLKHGISAHFDQATLERLKRESSLQLPHPRTGKPYTLTQAEMDDRLTLDMVEVAKKIQKTKVLTLHGQDDATIPVSDAEEFDRHIANHTLRIIPGADHTFSKHGHIVVEQAALFLTEGLEQ